MMRLFTRSLLLPLLAGGLFTTTALAQDDARDDVRRRHKELMERRAEHKKLIPELTRRPKVKARGLSKGVSHAKALRKLAAKMAKDGYQAAAQRLFREASMLQRQPVKAYPWSSTVEQLIRTNMSQAQEQLRRSLDKARRSIDEALRRSDLSRDTERRLRAAKRSYSEAEQKMRERMREVIEKARRASQRTVASDWWLYPRSSKTPRVPRVARVPAAPRHPAKVKKSVIQRTPRVYRSKGKAYTEFGVPVPRGVQQHKHEHRHTHKHEHHGSDALPSRARSHGLGQRSGRDSTLERDVRRLRNDVSALRAMIRNLQREMRGGSRSQPGSRRSTRRSRRAPTASRPAPRRPVVRGSVGREPTPEPVRKPQLRRGQLR